MKEEKWFIRKTYGWGWVPVTWQGWMIVLAFIIILILNGINFSSEVSEGDISFLELILFFIVIILSVFFLLWICYKKGEKPRWRWGN